MGSLRHLSTRVATRSDGMLAEAHGVGLPRGLAFLPITGGNARMDSDAGTA